MFFGFGYGYGRGAVRVEVYVIVSEVCYFAGCSHSDIESIEEHVLVEFPYWSAFIIGVMPEVFDGVW